MFWLRPGLEEASPPLVGTAAPSMSAALDTALFDIDGVLIDARRSYRLAVMHATELIVRQIYGLAGAPSPLLTPEDVTLFKLAGGFNNDWDETRLLAAIWIARLREWRGRAEAAIPMSEWARQATEATQAGHGGAEWMLATFPASAIPDAEMARWAHDEFYWGSALMREHYGREAQFAPEAEGFIHNEELLLEQTILPALQRLGIAHFGIITGRHGPEVTWAIRHIAQGSGLHEGQPPAGVLWHEHPHGRSPFELILSGADYVKPDPQALAFAVRQLKARGAFYIGDTADDLALVLRYRQELQRDDVSLPPVLAIIVAEEAERPVYQQRGADIVLDAVGALPAALSALQARISSAREP